LPYTNARKLILTRQHQVVFGLLLALSILIGWRPLSQTVLLAIQNDEYTHILLVLPVSVSLIVLERRMSRIKNEWSFRLGSALLGIAVLSALYAHATLHWTPQDIHLASEMLAVVLSWIGVFALCFGAVASQSNLFPLILLFALVPLPRCILNPIIALLQLGSAWSAHAFLAAFGIPVLQKGVEIAIPGLTIQVAQECSSIRSSSMLLLTAIILAQIFLRAFWRKALVGAFALLLSVVKNGLRIFVIAYLGTRVNPGYLNGRLHRHGGIIYFVAALACVVAAIWICRRGEGAPHALDLAGAGLPETGMN
jgi:exosortase